MRLITNILRDFIWGITYAVLWLMDMVFGVTMDVATLNISDISKVWEMWAVLITLLGIFVTFRILFMALKYYTDTEGKYSFSIAGALVRALIIVILIGGMPFFTKQATGAGQIAIKNINLVTGAKSDTMPSTLIVSSIHASVYETEEGTSIPKDYRIQDISINQREGDSYVFFNSLNDIFVILIVGGIAVVGFFLNALQIAQRMFSLGAKILISPIPISSLVDADSEQFSLWLKMCSSDIISNFVQILLLYLVIMVSSSTEIRLKGVWVTIVVLLGGLLTLLQGVPELSRLIGGDTSGSSIIQQFASIRQATRGGGGISRTAKTLAKVSGGAAGTAMTAGAIGAYGAGRALGGKSISDINADNTSNFAGSNEANKNNNFVHTGGKNSHQNYGGTQQGGNYQSGDYQGGVNQSGYTNADMNMNANMNNAMHGSSSHTEGPQTQSSYQDNTAGNTQQTQQTQANFTSGLSRDNTFASNVAKAAFTKHGLSGAGAKIASFGGGHIYASSINRIQRSAPARMMRRGKSAFMSVPTVKPISPSNHKGGQSS